MNIELGSFVSWDQGPTLEKWLEWRADVVEYDTFKTQRNQVSSGPRRHWPLQWEIMPTANRDKLIELFGRAHGEAITFLYKDDDDYNSISVNVGDGSTTAFQLSE